MEEYCNCPPHFEMPKVQRCSMCHKIYNPISFPSPTTPLLRNIEKTIEKFYPHYHYDLVRELYNLFIKERIDGTTPTNRR